MVARITRLPALILLLTGFVPDDVAAQERAVEWSTSDVIGWQEAMVDVGGHSLSVACAGTGSPVVLIEAGGRVGKWDWQGVIPLLAPETRACAYSRAGIGESDQPPPEDVFPGIEGSFLTTPQATIDDLSSLL